MLSHIVVVNSGFKGPFRAGAAAGTAGLSLTAAAAAAYNPTYAAAALYGALGTGAAYDTVYPTSYGGIPGYPGYSPATFPTPATGYPTSGYELHLAASRDARYPGMQGVQSKEVLNAQ